MRDDELSSAPAMTLHATSMAFVKVARSFLTNVFLWLALCVSHWSSEKKREKCETRNWEAQQDIAPRGASWAICFICSHSWRFTWNGGCSNELCCSVRWDRNLEIWDNPILGCGLGQWFFTQNHRSLWCRSDTERIVPNDLGTKIALTLDHSKAHNFNVQTLKRPLAFSVVQKGPLNWSWCNQQPSDAISGRGRKLLSEWQSSPTGKSPKENDDCSTAYEASRTMSTWLSG